MILQVETSTLGGTWDDETNTCTFTNSIGIGSKGSLTVDENVTVVLQGGAGFRSGVLTMTEVLSTITVP